VRGGRIVEAPRFSEQLNRAMKGVLEGYGALMEYLRRVAHQKRIQFLFNEPV